MGPKGWGAKPRKSEGPKLWGPEVVGAPKGGEPKISRFFFHLPPQFFVFFPSLLVFFVEFWWCLKRRGAQMCTFGVLGVSCASPGGPVWWGRPTFYLRVCHPEHSLHMLPTTMTLVCGNVSAVFWAGHSPLLFGSQQSPTPFGRVGVAECLSHDPCRLLGQLGRLYEHNSAETRQHCPGPWYKPSIRPRRQLSTWSDVRVPCPGFLFPPSLPLLLLTPRSSFSSAHFPAHLFLLLTSPLIFSGCFCFAGSRTCRCGRLLDVLGHHVQRVRGQVFLEVVVSPWRVQLPRFAVRPAPAFPRTSSSVIRDLDLAVVGQDGRRLEVVSCWFTSVRWCTIGDRHHARVAHQSRWVALAQHLLRPVSQTAHLS